METTRTYVWIKNKKKNDTKADKHILYQVVNYYFVLRLSDGNPDSCILSKCVIFVKVSSASCTSGPFLHGIVKIKLVYYCNASFVWCRAIFFRKYTLAFELMLKDMYGLVQ